MFHDDTGDAYLDILGVLREKEGDSKDSVLYQDYAQIFLVFDMDPQSGQYNPVMMKRALEYFNEPSDNGRLYINYPMVESYRHIPSDDFDAYKDLIVTWDGIRCYKSLVDKEGLKSLRQPNSIDRSVMLLLMKFNLRKLNHVLRQDDSLPDDLTYGRLDLVEFFVKQSSMLDEKGCIYVLNTFLVGIVDHNPAKILSGLNDLRIDTFES